MSKIVKVTVSGLVLCGAGLLVSAETPAGAGLPVTRVCKVAEQISTRVDASIPAGGDVDPEPGSFRTTRDLKPTPESAVFAW